MDITTLHPESLAYRILNKKGKFANDDKDWVQFVKDHRSIIFAEAERRDIDPGDMFHFRYRPEDYLISISTPRDMWWILLYINQIPSHRQFVGIDRIWIPKISTIVGLHGQYKIQKELLTGTVSALFE